MTLSPSQKTSRRRALLLRIGLMVLGVLAPILMVLFAELAVRLSGRTPSALETEYFDRSERYLDRCLHVSIHGGRLSRVHTRSEDPRAFAFPKPRGMRRIVVIGESTAGMLASGLAARYDCPNVEVIDCAQGGSALEHMERRFDEVIGYQPDAIVALFGHNLTMHYETRPVQARLAQIRAHSGLLGLFAPPSTVRPPPVDMHARVDRYEHWLATASRRARAAGVRFVVNTPMRNPWFAPQQDANRGAGEFQALRFLEATAHTQEFAAMLQQEPASATIWFERGVSAGDAGRDTEADRMLSRSMELSAIGSNRAPVALYEAVRRTARVNGISLVDADALLRTWAGPLPDWTHFADAMHPSYGVIQRVADENLLLLNRELGPVGCTPRERSIDTLQRMLDGLLTLPPETSIAWSRSLEIAVSQWLRLDPTTDAIVSQWLTSQPYAAALSARRGRVLAGLSLGYLRAGRAERAREIFALAPPPEDPVTATDQAMYLLRAGRSAEARTCLERFAGQEPARSVRRWIDEPTSLMTPLRL